MMGSDRVAHSADKRRETVDFSGTALLCQSYEICLSLLVLMVAITTPLNLLAVE
jgi:hypothetical protein